jgi:hypothetical protein
VWTAHLAAAVGSNLAAPAAVKLPPATVTVVRPVGGPATGLTSVTGDSVS